jgi:aryl-alcohol dehydrogenase-like predicted oxidoreductase
VIFDERTRLAPDYEISRVIRGGWQLAGGHGPVDRDATQADLMAFYEAGVTTFDCADIYTGVEAMIGDFRAATHRRLGASALARLKVHTKFVPDLGRLARIDRAHVREIIERSLARLRMERLDLVQFHWWDYAVGGWLETMGWLAQLRDEGKIELIGGTNFDTAHLEAFAAAGAPMASLQVQYSLLDDRPETAMTAACARLGTRLICYGVLAGGFISERWLGAPEPAGPLANRSLTKYRLIIEEIGGWEVFQHILGTLAAIAGKHGVDIAAVASRAMLDKPAVAAVIIGARDASHLPALAHLAALALDDDDRAALAAALAMRTRPPGDVFELERDRHGRHGAIMRYDLNETR